MGIKKSTESFAWAKQNFLNSENAANESIALPIYPELADEQIEFIVKEINNFLNSVCPKSPFSSLRLR